MRRTEVREPGESFKRTEPRRLRLYAEMALIDRKNSTMRKPPQRRLRAAEAKQKRAKCAETKLILIAPA